MFEIFYKSLKMLENVKEKTIKDAESIMNPVFWDINGKLLITPEMHTFGQSDLEQANNNNPKRGFFNIYSTFFINRCFILDLNEILNNNV